MLLLYENVIMFIYHKHSQLHHLLISILPFPIMVFSSLSLSLSLALYAVTNIYIFFVAVVVA